MKRKNVVQQWMGLGAVMLCLSGCSVFQPTAYEPREGDVVFQALPLDVDLMAAIEGITQSHFTHAGAVVRHEGEWKVIEAVGEGVVYTPWEKWKAASRDGRWAVYRVKAKHSEHVPGFVRQLHPHAGKPYDFKYQITTDKLYCSELVFQAWKTATGQEMGQLIKLGDMNWRPHHATIEKYNEGPVPLEREIISPVALSRAQQLELVYNHGLKK